MVTSTASSTASDLPGDEHQRDVARVGVVRAVLAREQGVEHPRPDLARPPVQHEHVDDPLDEREERDQHDGGTSASVQRQSPTSSAGDQRADEQRRRSSTATGGCTNPRAASRRVTWLRRLPVIRGLVVAQPGERPGVGVGEAVRRVARPVRGVRSVSLMGASPVRRARPAAWPSRGRAVRWPGAARSRRRRR